MNLFFGDYLRHTYQVRYEAHVAASSVSDLSAAFIPAAALAPYDPYEPSTSCAPYDPYVPYDLSALSALSAPCDPALLLSLYDSLPSQLNTQLQAYEQIKPDAWMTAHPLIWQIGSNSMQWIQVQVRPLRERVGLLDDLYLNPYGSWLMDLKNDWKDLPLDREQKLLFLWHIKQIDARILAQQAVWQEQIHAEELADFQFALYEKQVKKSGAERKKPFKCTKLYDLELVFFQEHTFSPDKQQLKEKPAPEYGVEGSDLNSTLNKVLADNFAQRQARLEGALGNFWANRAQRMGQFQSQHPQAAGMNNGSGQAFAQIAAAQYQSGEVPEAVIVNSLMRRSHHRVFHSLYRKPTILECDRELFMINVFMGILAVFCCPNIIVIILTVGICMLNFGFLVLMGRSDPLMRVVYIQQLKYLPFYQGTATVREVLNNHHATDNGILFKLLT